jgi:hypothetical protein
MTPPPALLPYGRSLGTPLIISPLWRKSPSGANFSSTMVRCNPGVQTGWSQRKESRLQIEVWGGTIQCSAMSQLCLTPRG